MASHNYIIGFLKYYHHLANRTYTYKQTQESNKNVTLWSGRNLTLKSLDHASESYNKFKNVLLKITQLSP